jgi:hypothetical protein
MVHASDGEAWTHFDSIHHETVVDEEEDEVQNVKDLQMLE